MMKFTFRTEVYGENYTEAAVFNNYGDKIIGMTGEGTNPEKALLNLADRLEDLARRAREESYRDKGGN